MKSTKGYQIRGFSGGPSDKQPHLPMQETQEMLARSWVRKIPWRRKWQPTPEFWPGESHGQRSLESYSPWGHKELATTEVTEHACTKFHLKLFCLLVYSQ